MDRASPRISHQLKRANLTLAVDCANKPRRPRRPHTFRCAGKQGNCAGAFRGGLRPPFAAVQGRCMAVVPSPCTGVCRIEPRTGWCAGCGRTLREIADWPMLDAAGQRRLLARLDQRRAAPR